MTSPDLPKIMDLVRTFCFEHNLLGEKRQVEGRDRHRNAAGDLGDRRTSSCASIRPT